MPYEYDDAESYPTNKSVESSPVQSELVEHEISINNLFETIARLRNRLSPVLSPSPESAMKELSEPRPTQTTIAGVLRERNVQLHRLDKELNSLISLLEI